MNKLLIFIFAMIETGLLVGCSMSVDHCHGEKNRANIPAAALGVADAVFEDFKGSLNMSLCMSEPDLNSCAHDYGVVVEKRGDDFYFLFIPGYGSGEVVKGGGISYLVDSNGKIIKKTLQK